MVVTLVALEEDALMRILTEPKNALVKQYQKLLAMDGVNLLFEEEALRLIAKNVLNHKTGARGLRAAIEDIMRNVMFEVPSIEGASLCRATAEVVSQHKEPELVVDKNKGNRALGKRAATA